MSVLCGEKRRHARVSIEWPITLDTDAGSYRTLTTDVSLGGVAFQCRLCRDAGAASGDVPEECPLRRHSTAANGPEPLRLRAELPGPCVLKTEIQVVHVEGSGGAEGHVVGAAFLSMSCSDFDRLSSALAVARPE